VEGGRRRKGKKDRSSSPKSKPPSNSSRRPPTAIIVLIDIGANTQDVQNMGYHPPDIQLFFRNGSRVQVRYEGSCLRLPLSSSLLALQLFKLI